ncbi:MAG: sensor histidine kinase [Spirochaetaceae bacterium]|nr:MAG: sensor histidine kinase [Spirochaetaceae bacterium]
MRWTETRQKIALVVLAISAVAHAVAIGYAVIGAGWYDLRFPGEFVFFIVASFICSVAVFCVDPVRKFVYFHAARIASVITAVAILAGRVPAIELLVLIPFILDTALYLPWRRSLIINVGVVAVVVLVDAVAFGSDPNRGFFSGLGPVILISSIVTGYATLLVYYRERIVSNERRIDELGAAIDSLSSANRAIQVYADQIESQSAADERNRITRELHDTVGYSLTNIIMTMSAGKVLAARDTTKLPELFDGARKQAEETLEETRRTLYRLRSIRDHHPEGLRAVGHLVKSFREATGVNVELNYGNVPVTLGPTVDAALFRLIQEGLTNAFRHGHAKTVRLNLWMTDDEIIANVWDDGTGADVIDVGIGLAGMHERFTALGGFVVAENVAGGFHLRGVIPRQRINNVEDTRTHR